MNTPIIRRERVHVKALYSTSPLPPLNPRAPYDAEAVLDLVDRGARLVLLHHYPDKKPVVNTCSASYSDTFAHVVGMNGLVGLYPSSVGLTALDVDRGTDLDVDKLASAWPPLTILRTPRRFPRPGLHFYYHDDVERGSPIWDWRSVGGEAKSAKGYAVVYPGEEQFLLNALDRPRTRTIEELIDQIQLPLWPIDQLRPSPAPSKALPAVAQGFRFAPSVRRAQGQHQRHITLMDLTLTALGRAVDMRGNFTSTLSLMLRYNAEFPEPLADGEVERLCPYFVEYSRHWENQPHTPQFLARQRRKGLRSGVVRRDAVWARDVAIRVSRESGVSIKDLMLMFDLSHTSIKRITARR